LVRVAIGFTSATAAAGASAPAAPQQAAIHSIPAHTVAFQQPVTPETPAAKSGEAADLAAKAASLHPVRRFIVVLLAIMAAITCTFGNLVAYGQTNIKRLLAYSTIA